MTQPLAAQAARSPVSTQVERSRRLGPCLSGALLFLVLAALASPSEAQTYDFAVSGGCSEQCAAYAAITPGNGMLTITLTDTQANPASAADLLSGIDFTINGMPGNASLASQTGSLVSLAKSGVASEVPGDLVHWGVGVSGRSIVLETAGSFAAGGAPIDMILGPPGASGRYTGNASVTNGHFSPYVDGSATFVVLDSMVTAMTTFTSVNFHFGTTPDTILVGHAVSPVDTPEPTSLAIFTMAVFGLAFPLARRRRRTSRPRSSRSFCLRRSFPGPEGPSA
jgi:hypothetical protein